MTPQDTPFPGFGAPVARPTTDAAAAAWKDSTPACSRSDGYRRRPCVRARRLEGAAGRLPCCCPTLCLATTGLTASSARRQTRAHHWGSAVDPLLQARAHAPALLQPTEEPPDGDVALLVCVVAERGVRRLVRPHRDRSGGAPLPQPPADGRVAVPPVARGPLRAPPRRRYCPRPRRADFRPRLELARRRPRHSFARIAARSGAVGPLG